MSSGNSAMILERGNGWTRGLRNMLAGELGRWFRTRSWLINIAIWTASVNLIYVGAASSMKGSGLEALEIFNIFMGLVVPVGVSIATMTAVTGEKREGTAAWILSKPVSRPAFLVSKLVANGLGLALTLVLAQGLIAYLITGLIVRTWMPPLPFLAALGAHYSHVLFYLTFALMLGVLFDHPAPVIGIPIGFMMAQNFLGPKLVQLSSAFTNVLPWTIAIPMNNTTGSKSVAMALMTGAQPPLTAVYVALAASAVFVTVAIVVFRRQEL